MSAPPVHPDIRRRIRARLLDFSPRAFELFAGNLLEYIGLQNVAVTQYSGDGGIDAHGELVAVSNLVRVPTGVQVKRHRNNVGRPDIDRFIGALLGHFNHGIFITTADYAPKALLKATDVPAIRIDTVSGEQVAALMVQHHLGTMPSSSSGLDDDYFQSFEALAGAKPKKVREQSGSYMPSTEEDLITLQTLSYALRVEATTIRRNWIETGKLVPDATEQIGSRSFYFFRRDRIEAIRKQFQLAPTPQTGEEWRQDFLDFSKSRNLTKSYKPVLLKALLDLVDRNGEVSMDALAEAFRAFYIQRKRNGLVTEIGVSVLLHPEQADLDTIEKLIIKYPLERFVLNGFLQYDADAGIVRFNPSLWHELRAYELVDILNSADEQLRFYYKRAST
jgi:hypothetical protein